MKAHLCLSALLLSAATPALAQDPEPAMVPAAVRALEGCRRGDGVAKEQVLTR